jgi:2-polyprenyl-3-methyl-5-hydroxy-6-metoxy-1,4-benzoquinol methylase
MKVIDVGCGPGIYVKALLDAGIDATGIDIDKSNPYIKMDIFSEEFLQFTNYDLCICLEVAEHLPDILSDELIKRLIHTSDTILFSAAQPGQGGFGHINLKPKSHWISKFESYNYILDESSTDALIKFIQGDIHMGWFVNNAMVFKSYGKMYYNTIVEEETPQANRLAQYLRNTTL